MRNPRVIAAVVLLLGLAPLASLAQGPRDTPANFAVRPNAEQMQAIYPTKARATGADGNAVIQCIVTLTGGLRNCAVVSEKPEGLDFGKAALGLAPQFMMRPATKGGRPVESPVQIPVFFPGIGKAIDSFVPGDRRPTGNRLLTNVIWREAPTYDDLIAVYPQGAKAKQTAGRALLNCVFADEGKLAQCTTLNETPAGQKFGDAARRLTSRFTGPVRFADGVSTKGSFTQIPVTFNPKILARRDAIPSPRWLNMPDAAAMNTVFPAKARAEGVTQARAVLDCKVAANGGLAGCGVLSETPPDYGFGEGALRLAPLFRMPVWSEDGSPVVGASIRLPLRYDLPATSAAAPR